MTLKTPGTQTLTVLDMSNRSIMGSTSVSVGTVPAIAALALGTGAKSSGGRVHDAIALQASQSRTRGGAALERQRKVVEANRRRTILQADWARDRILAELKGNLQAYLMAERLVGGHRD